MKHRFKNLFGGGQLDNCKTKNNLINITKNENRQRGGADNSLRLICSLRDINE